MLVSFNWLKQYIDLPDSLTPEEVAHKLTMSTVEVEGIEKQGQNLEKIVVGKVASVQKHPNADKLNICTVEFGEKYPVQIVCGGSNVHEGMLVALAGLGAKVRWHGEGELVELQKVKIRDVESYGMICASTEIGLGKMFPLKEEKEILDLTELKLKVGQPLFEALGLNDAVFDIDNKSMTHRPDLWGHYGLAREVAALFNKKLKEYKVQEIKKTKKQEINLSVKVEDVQVCPRYLAVAISGVKVTSSSEWLQQKLLAVGLRPINNIVDITNYIMYDLGQPMHAFDATRLSQKSKDKSQKTIVVRRASDGERFVTLDGKEHELTSENLLIADEEKAIALAGVMGGLNSEINDNTDIVIFESANFNAVNVRRTALQHAARTDSSARFEKSLDPNLCELALKKAVELTLELCPKAKVASKVIDEAHFRLNQGPIELPLSFLKMKMGIDISEKKVIDILTSIGFEVKIKKDVLLVTVPTWRATKDISIKEDLIEEIARVYGYDNFSTILPLFPIIPPERNELRLLERQIKNILSLECGFTETYNYSFVSPVAIQKMGFSLEKHIELSNPIAKDKPYLRVSLLPNLLENVEKNLHVVDNLKLFEVGKVFDISKPGQRVENNSDELLPRQNTMLSLVYSAKGTEQPFYAVSAVVAELMKKFGVEYLLEPAVEIEHKFIHPGRQALLKVGEDVFGIITELHPQVQASFGIEQGVGLVELNLDRLLEYSSNKSKYQKLPLYPAVVRDLAFVVDKNIVHAKIVETLSKVDTLITNVELFDVYEGKNLGENKKSLAYHLTYQSPERTLTTEEVDKIQEKVIKIIVKDFKGEVRK